MDTECVKCSWCGGLTSVGLYESSIQDCVLTKCELCFNDFEVVWNETGVRSSFPTLKLYGDSGEELIRIKNILISEGFYNPGLLQNNKPGQVFGLVRDMEDVWQMHVRGYEDGYLEAEIEISRWHLEHLREGPTVRRSAQFELAQILDRYGVLYQTINHTNYIEPLEVPQTVTDWRPLVLVSLFLVGVWWMRSR